MRRRRVVLLALALALALVAGLAFALVKPWAFLHHEPIVLGLPWSESDPPDGLIPMGETLYHPDTPRGHPGIDLGWDDDAPHVVVAAHDAKVTRVKMGESTDGKWDVELRSGVFLLRYRELETVAPGVEPGARLARGDPVGTAGRFCDDKGGGGAPHCWSNAHWELASVSFLLDRWCPLPYFDAPSRAAIDALWESLPPSRIKTEFPDLCSGGYAGRVAP